MKVSLNKMLALGGICALFGCVGTGAFAQDYNDHRMNRDHVRADETGYSRDRGPMSVQRARRELAVLKMTYDHEIRSGHLAVAMRAHLRAKAIRARLREQHWDRY